MVSLKFKIQITYYFGFGTLFLMLFLNSCQIGKSDKNSFQAKDLTDQLAAGADIETIAEHLIKVRQSVGITRALAIHYPNLDREKAFQIQMMTLAKLEEQGERLIGWKMSGTRKSGFNPGFGFMLESDKHQTGSIVNSSKFVAGIPLVEAEIGFVLKKDLLAQVITKDELVAAIKSVGGYSEFISVRTRDAEGGTKATSAHFIADGLSHGGFVQPQRKFSLDEVDINKEKGSVEINGEIIVEGDSKEFALLDAVLYLANTLPKYGRHLRAGDIVMTGSILDAPPARAGDKVEINFSTFESLNIKFK